MPTYSIYIYGEPWPEHGSIMLEGLSNQKQAIAIVRAAMKNDHRIDKCELWQCVDFEHTDRVFTKIRGKAT